MGFYPFYPLPRHFLVLIRCRYDPVNAAAPDETVVEADKMLVQVRNRLQSQDTLL